MSNKIINLKEENECLNKEEEVNDWLRKDLIYKYDFVDKSINFFLENFKKDGYDKNNSDNLLSKYDSLFYDNIYTIKEKFNLDGKINILNNEIMTDKDRIYNIYNKENELMNFNEINNNILLFFDNYCEIIKEIANSIIIYSDNILKEINNLKKDFNENKTKIIENRNKIIKND